MSPGLPDPDGAVEDLLAGVTRWAGTRPDVAAVALVGSRARGTAGPGSDVDLVLLVDDPAALLGDGTWVAAVFGPGVSTVRVRAWGPLTERRLRRPDGSEVDVGVTAPTWAAVPLDPGTAGVLRDGVRVLHDPRGLLARATADDATGTPPHHPQETACT
ncbi:nucleotidyltransferase domain-containing protein [Aquipuribacter sp. SD81]|uniref:nucleotidyltransferase domain-containing protein n=1 Tax=Aquipuribacter sp. SD81 TaxID=3127703 RepID=UPI0030180C49